MEQGFCSLSAFVACIRLAHGSRDMSEFLYQPGYRRWSQRKSHVMHAST